MKTTILVSTILLLISSLHPRMYDPKDLKYSPLKPIKRLDYKKFKLSNGIKVYLLEDHSLPIFRIAGFIRAGSAYLSAKDMYKPHLAMKMLETGGTTRYKPDELDTLIENNAIEIGFDEDNDKCTFRGRSVAENKELLINLFTEMLTNPRFDTMRLEIIKDKEIDNIRRSLEKPDWLAYFYFMKYVYGEDSPLGRLPDQDGIKKINRDDLVSWYNNWIYPEDMYIAVVGDFSSKEMMILLNETLGKWKKEGKANAIIPEYKKENLKPGIYLIPMDINQASIEIGHQGIEKWDKRLPQVDMFNKVLGDDSDSRLYKEIRESQGLAYSVWGGIFRGVPIGTFRVELNTKPTTIDKTIDGIMKILKDMKEHEVNAEDLRGFKEKQGNLFVFNFRKPMQALLRIIDLDFYGKSLDTDEVFLRESMEVKASDILSIAKELVDTDRFVMVVVGPSSLEKVLSKYGKVNVIKLKDDSQK